MPSADRLSQRTAAVWVHVMDIGFDPCGDQQTKVGPYALSCPGCLHLVHKKYNGIEVFYVQLRNKCAPDART